jgi:hypothetical protein
VIPAQNGGYRVPRDVELSPSVTECQRVAG